jgi:hypothetical protein
MKKLTVHGLVLVENRIDRGAYTKWDKAYNLTEFGCRAHHSTAQGSHKGRK